MANDELFQRAMTEEDFGKGIVTLPADTVIPEGNIIFLCNTNERYGSGIMQSVMNDFVHEEIRRTDDGTFVLSYQHANSETGTDDLYKVPEEYMACLNRIVRNSGMAGWNKLPHNYLPGFLAPFNTETPKYDMELRLETDTGEITSTLISKYDVHDNKGSDILYAVLQLMEACRTEANLLRHTEKEALGIPQPLPTINMSNIRTTQPEAPKPAWDCACGSVGNPGNFCPQCGAKRPDN